jgi:hypothetical protein
LDADASIGAHAGKRAGTDRRRGACRRRAEHGEEFSPVHIYSLSKPTGGVEPPHYGVVATSVGDFSDYSSAWEGSVRDIV